MGKTYREKENAFADNLVNSLLRVIQIPVTVNS